MTANGTHLTPAAYLAEAQEMRKSLPTPEEASREALEELRALVADDAYATSFQSMGQYRTALLAAIRALIAKPAEDQS